MGKAFAAIKKKTSTLMWSVASRTCTRLRDSFHHSQCLATLPQSQSPKCNGWTLILASKFSTPPVEDTTKTANPSRTNKGGRKSYSRAREDENVYSNFPAPQTLSLVNLFSALAWRKKELIGACRAKQTFCTGARVKVDRNLHQLSKASADTHLRH